jgi:hypothetical protein
MSILIQFSGNYGRITRRTHDRAPPNRRESVEANQEGGNDGVTVRPKAPPRQADGPLLLRLLIAALLVGLPVALLALATSSATESPGAQGLVCAQSAPLQPHTLPGDPWERHRHWLEGPPMGELSRYVIVNGRTGDTYDWAYWGPESGRSRFGVSTRWTWFHAGWDQDPWKLEFDCQPPSGG